MYIHNHFVIWTLNSSFTKLVLILINTNYTLLFVLIVFNQFTKKLMCKLLLFDDRNMGARYKSLSRSCRPGPGSSRAPSPRRSTRASSVTMTTRRRRWRSCARRWTRWRFGMRRRNKPCWRAMRASRNSSRCCKVRTL